MFLFYHSLVTCADTGCSSQNVDFLSPPQPCVLHLSWHIILIQRDGLAHTQGRLFTFRGMGFRIYPKTDARTATLKTSTPQTASKSIRKRGAKIPDIQKSKGLFILKKSLFIFRSNRWENIASHSLGSGKQFSMCSSHLLAASFNLSSGIISHPPSPEFLKCMKANPLHNSLEY